MHWVRLVGCIFDKSLVGQNLPTDRYSPAGPQNFFYLIFLSSDTTNAFFQQVNRGECNQVGGIAIG